MIKATQNPAGRNTEILVSMAEPKIYGENADKYVNRSFTQRSLEKAQARELASMTYGYQAVSIKFDHDVLSKGFDAALMSVTLEGWENNSITYSGLNLAKMPAEVLDMAMKIYGLFRFNMRQCSRTWYVVSKIGAVPLKDHNGFKSTHIWDGKTVRVYNYPLHPTECGTHLISPIPKN